MPKSKGFFVLDIPTKELITRISKHPVHFFAKTLDGTALMVNDLQAQYFASTTANKFHGKNYFDFVSTTEAKTMQSHDITAISTPTPHLCYETCLDKDCLCIKSQLKDSCNRVIGIGGLGFYFHQITFKDIITVTNGLLSSPPIITNFANSYIFNNRALNMLSYREKECAYYLTKSMTYKEIAKILNLSPRTVETHIENIKNKLKCYKRSDIVVKIFEDNLGE